MDKFVFNDDPKCKTWFDNFNLPKERASFLRKASAPFLRKYSDDDNYTPSNFTRDYILTANQDNVNEIMYTAFEAGRLLTLAKELSRSEFERMITEAAVDNDEACNCPKCRIERGENPGEVLAEVLMGRNAPKAEARKSALRIDLEVALAANFGDKVEIVEDPSNPFASFGIKAKGEAQLTAEFASQVEAVLQPILEKHNFTAQRGAGFDEMNLRDMFAKRKPKAEA